MWQLPILEYAPPNKPVLQYPESRPPPAPILVRYNRWGDIWSGLVQKRVLDARGEVMLVNGRASVLHERMSDPQRNAEIEAPGMPLNERLWGGLSQPFEYRSKEITDLFKVFTDKASRYIEPSGAYYHHFLSCRDQWLALFQ